VREREREREQKSVRRVSRDATRLRACRRDGTCWAWRAAA
jgi:hypothetical protein